MISCKYEKWKTGKNEADFFEPPELLLTRSKAKSYSLFLWLVMFNLTIFWVLSFSEHRNLVNIRRLRRRITHWVVYNQLYGWRLLFAGYCPGAFLHIVISARLMPCHQVISEAGKKSQKIAFMFAKLLLSLTSTIVFSMLNFTIISSFLS